MKLPKMTFEEVRELEPCFIGYRAAYIALQDAGFLEGPISVTDAYDAGVALHQIAWIAEKGYKADALAEFRYRLRRFQFDCATRVLPTSDRFITGMTLRAAMYGYYTTLHRAPPRQDKLDALLAHADLAKDAIRVLTAKAVRPPVVWAPGGAVTHFDIPTRQELSAVHAVMGVPHVLGSWVERAVLDALPEDCETAEREWQKERATLWFKYADYPELCPIPLKQGPETAADARTTR